MQRLKIGVLGSGKGSNFGAILAAREAGELDIDPVLVLSDVEGAGILSLAASAGIPCGVISEPKFRTRLSPEVEADVVRRLREAGAELVVLAGYMRMVKAPLLDAFPNRVINIHPSLLPKFPGLEAWRQALEAGESTTGCTVHYVDEGMDSGPVIAQAEVPVLPDDTAQSLHARIQVAEHRLYPGVLRRFARRELP
jgi:phosphoribosylglycinamide formyltransferase-1